MFADAGGEVFSFGPGSAEIFAGDAPAGTFWEILGLPVRGLEQALERYPPGRVHEVHAPGGKGTFALRIIALPGSVSPSGPRSQPGLQIKSSAVSAATGQSASAPARAAYVIIATDNRPIVQLREVYKERIGEKIQALDNSIRLFGAMFDGIRDAMLLLGGDHIIHAANPRAQELLDPNRLGLAGRYVRSLFAPLDWDKVGRKLSSLKDGGRWTSRRICVTTRGDELPMELTLWRIDLEGLTLFHLALRDLTAQTLLEKGLRRKKAEVEGMNLALRNVVQSTEQEKHNVRREILGEIQNDILPALDRMAQENSPELRRTLKAMIEERIHEMAAGAFNQLSPLLLKLTPREIEVCKLIRLGKGTREIAELLNASFETIQTHRKNIRRKLGLRGRGASLFSFLHQREFPE